MGRSFYIRFCGWIIHSSVGWLRSTSKQMASKSCSPLVPWPPPRLQVRVVPWLLDGGHPMVLRALEGGAASAESRARGREAGEEEAHRRAGADVQG